MAAEMRKQKIIEGVMAGKTATAVAKDVGMCRQHVNNACSISLTPLLRA
jgi:DNA-binding phage protein